MKVVKRFFTNAINYITFTLFDKRALLYYFKNNTEVLKLSAIKHLYYSCKSADVEFLYFNEKTKELHFKTTEGVRIVSNDYFHIFIEIFCNKMYCTYEDYVQKQFVMIDAGANRGYSALYFANNPLCEKVYSYEPDNNTFAYLQKNMLINPDLAKKINAFNFGFSDKNDTLTFFHHDKTDGINSSDEAFLNHYDKKRKSQMRTTKIDVKKASDVIGEIIAQNSKSMQFILKIDIEGAEYDVLADMRAANQLHQFSMIFGECHKGFEKIMEICGDSFECVLLNKCNVAGLFNFVIINKNNR